MRTSEIKVWDGTGTPTDYQYKDRDWGTGQRVRAIAIKARRQAPDGGRSFRTHAVYDGVLLVHLNDDGTPKHPTTGWGNDQVTHTDELAITVGIPRFLTDKWDAAMDAAAVAAQYRTAQDAAAIERKNRVLRLIGRANAATAGIVKNTLGTYDINKYGVTISVSQLQALVERAEKN